MVESVGSIGEYMTFCEERELKPIQQLNNYDIEL